jgi:hypothetical protein
MQFQRFTAIEILGKQIRKREGAPFLWRLLVSVLTQSHCFISILVFPLEFVRQDC